MPVPVDQESPFSVEELFYSTTDRRGVITQGNDVFVRVSAYHRDHLIGRPHSLIRHPDMPRSIFHLLWSTIQAGKPIAAFVKNMAADGRYYWVLATVFPTDSGYLSVRVKPTPQQIALIAPLYKRVREVEAEGFDPGLNELTRAVQALGFPSYDAFSTACLSDALAARRTADHRRAARRSDLGARLEQSTRGLNDLLSQVDALTAARDQLVEQVATVSGSTDALRLLVLNMRVNATRGGSAGVTLDQVARGLDRFAAEILKASDAFSRVAQAADAALVSARFLVLAAALQVEMNLFFSDEFDHAGRAMDDGLRTQFAELLNLPTQYLGKIVDTTRTLNGETAKLGAVSRLLDATLVGLEVIRVMGRIESARLAPEAARTFHVQLAQLGTVFESNRAAVQAVSAIAARIRGRTETVRAGCAAVSTQLDDVRGELARAAHADAPQSDPNAPGSDEPDFAYDLD